MDIQPNTYAGLRELALFAGAGGGIQASRMLGWHTVCAVEWDDYANLPPDHPNYVPRVATGIKHRAARIKCIGNGQVPHCAATAFVILADRLESING